MKLWEHRGSIGDSMATCVEIEPTLKALTNEINKKLRCFYADADASQVHVKPYAYDDGVGWDTHMVTVDGYGVYGFTDGWLEDGACSLGTA